MASVHLGRDWRADAAHPVLALKVMREELAHDRAYVAMFLDEARILAKLDHPNLIATIEAGVGKIEGGVLESDSQPVAGANATSQINTEWRYIAMELLLGRPLADLWDLLAEQRERMPVRVSAAIASRVAHGLHYAHELLADDGSSYELVHRDVNPSNIFMTTRGQVKLIDFGLARAKDTDRAGGPGVVTGKITYLAPEQLTRRALDRRTDVYQLGITLWEMLTGARLFLRESQQATIAAVRSGTIPRPEELNPRVPRELSDLVLRSLAPDPDRRFTSMAGFARMLDRWIDSRGLHVEDEELVELFERVFPSERQRLEEWHAKILQARSQPPPQTNAPPATSAQPPPLPASASAALPAIASDPVVADRPRATETTPSPERPRERRAKWAWWKK